MKTTEKISGGYPIVGQVIQLMVFIPLILLLSYITFATEITGGGLVFWACCLVGVSVILRITFSYGEIYMAQEKIIIKTLFKEKTISLKEVKRVGESFLPFTYYIKYNQSKIHFSPRNTDLIKHLLSLHPNKSLELIREKFSKDD